MNAVYVCSDETIDFIPASNLDPGVFVVLGAIVGITKSPQTAGRLGTITTRGVFHNVPKINNQALTIGQKVWLNASTGKIYGTPAAGYLCVGYAMEAAQANASVCRILLSPTGETWSAS
ncbi:MAG: DUF2190 family protein [Planctomycetia bacterium]|nr:DUF2190 family protein [Planctomycetia bacterium]